MFAITMGGLFWNERVCGFSSDDLTLYGTEAEASEAAQEDARLDSGARLCASNRSEPCFAVNGPLARNRYFAFGVNKR